MNKLINAYASSSDDNESEPEKQVEVQEPPKKKKLTMPSIEAALDMVPESFEGDNVEDDDRPEDMKLGKGEIEMKSPRSC